MALATAEDVIRRLEEEPTERMQQMIEEYLEDASDTARFYGSQDWTDEECPAEARRIVAAAVARYIRNPDGFTQSRAADEMLGWNETDEPGAIKFTANEIARLQRLAPLPMASMGTIQVSAWGSGSAPRDEYVPWAGTNTPFPFIAYNDPLRVWKR